MKLSFLVWIAAILITSSCSINKQGQKFSVLIFGAKGDSNTDDTKAIKKAIQKAYSNNQTLFFPKGEYIVSETIELPSDIRIIGEKLSQISQRKAGAPIFAGRSIQNVSIENLKLIGLGLYDRSWKSSEGRGNRGIDLIGCKEITIKKCTLINHGQCAINITGGSKINIIANYIEGTHRKGVKLVQKDNYQFGVSVTVNRNFKFLNDIVIIDNEISYTTQGIITSQGIDGFVEKIKIFRNNVHDIIGQHGIYASTSNTIIQNNLIKRTGLEGIKIQAAHCILKNIKIKDNQVFDCYNSQAYNITEIKKGRNLISNVEFYNNTAQNCGRGMNISGRVKNIKIKNFNINSTTKQAGILIRGINADNISFSDVVITDAKEYGILINSKDNNGISFKNVTIINNRLKNKVQPVQIVNGANVSLRNININNGDYNLSDAIKTSENIINFRSKKVIINGKQVIGKSQ